MQRETATRGPPEAAAFVFWSHTSESDQEQGLLTHLSIITHYTEIPHLTAELVFWHV